MGNRLAFVLLSLLLLCSCAAPGEGVISDTAEVPVGGVEFAPAHSEAPAGHGDFDLAPDPGVDEGAGTPIPDVPPPTAEPPPPSREELEALFIESVIDAMTLEEQVAQLFIISLGAEHSSPTDDLVRFVSESGAGGFILFRENITTVEGTRALTDAIRGASAVAPFICVDEEGGVVSRLRSAGLPGYAAQPSARSVGDSGDPQNAFLAGEAIGSALSAIGVDVNFAPVADVLTNPRNSVIGSRSFGSDPEVVADMAAAFQRGLRGQGVMSAPKHFPGHGNTLDDSHFGRAVTASDAEHLAVVEYVPFSRLIGEGADFVMTGHIIVPEYQFDDLPATLSGYFVSDVLREGFGFGGVIITDAMNMGAITLEFGSSEAAVMAVQAGVDMILMPEDFDDAVSGLLRAVDDGEVSRERIRESLVRILQKKVDSGLLAM